jgi:hypothetical protein
MGYWGMSTVLAVSIAPTIGLWVYAHGGWTAMCVEAAVLNLLMAAIAWALPHDPPRDAARKPVSIRKLLEWRVLVLSFSLFLYSFGYGGLTSFVALYTDSYQVTPRALYFTLFCLTTVVTRPFIGRFADRVGYRRVFVCDPDRGGIPGAGGWRQPAVPDRVSRAFRHGLRFGVSGVPGARAAVRGRVAPRRHVRQHHRRVRYRHRHRLDCHGLDDPALRIPTGLGHGRRAGRAGDSVFSDRREESSTSDRQGCLTEETPGIRERQEPCPAFVLFVAFVAAQKIRGRATEARKHESLGSRFSASVASFHSTG